MNFLKPILVLVFLLVPFVLLAQPGDGGGDPDVPITGLEYLLGGGILLGIRRLLNFNKSDKKNP